MSDPSEENLVDARRNRLARKGEVLYHKSCQGVGEFSCVQGFILHHLGRGEPEIVQDLVNYLNGEVNARRADREDAHVERARNLIAWIGVQLNTFSGDRQNDITGARQ